MRRTTFLIAAALLAAPPLAGQPFLPSQPTPRPDEAPIWAPSFPRAVERARAIPGGRILVELREDQCPECDRLEKLLLPSATFRAFMADKVPVTVPRSSPDGDRLAQLFRIRSSPAWIVLTPDLLLCGKLEGDTNQSTWFSTFFEAEKAWAEFQKKLAAEAANPSDAAASFAVGEEAFRRLADSMADERFRRVAGDAKAPVTLRAMSLAYLATSALEARRLDDAEKALKQILALTKEPALVERAELRLADVEIGRGQRAKAESRLKAFVKDHPESPLKKQAEEILRVLATAKP